MEGGEKNNNLIPDPAFFSSSFQTLNVVLPYALRNQSVCLFASLACMLCNRVCVHVHICVIRPCRDSLHRLLL